VMPMGGRMFQKERASSKQKKREGGKGKRIREMRDGKSMTGKFRAQKKIECENLGDKKNHLGKHQHR